LSTFDDYLRSKGINAKATYTVAQVACLMGKHYQTVYRYCYLGVRAPRNGVITLPTRRNGPKELCILGQDLVEFLRQVQGE
jgi:hypothetical protein